MLDEIREQPAALERTLRASHKPAAELARALAGRQPKLVVLAARGTSDNAAQFGRYLIEITTGIPVSLAAPSITTLYRAPLHWRDALVVAISQSGESIDTNLVLEHARKAGALTLGITNESGSALSKLAQYLFPVRAGRERGIAATKTYTGQLLMLYVLARVLGADIRDDDLARLADWAAAALSLEDQVRARAERYRFLDRAVVVGRGLNYANAFEFSLKLMETCYVVAERFSGADFMHGPIALVDPENKVAQGFPVFVFAPAGVTWAGTRQMLAKLDSLGAETLLFTDASNPPAGKRRNAVVIPRKIARARAHPVELLSPIPYIVPAQLFAASLAAWRGLDPDRPRTITKVTRTL
jgi:glucosamine--fructose-6-phosphate aminotransferase (isomerizing)